MLRDPQACFGNFAATGCNNHIDSRSSKTLRVKVLFVLVQHVLFRGALVELHFKGVSYVILLPALYGLLLINAWTAS